MFVGSCISISVHQIIQFSHTELIKISPWFSQETQVKFAALLDNKVADQTPLEAMLSNIDPMIAILYYYLNSLIKYSLRDITQICTAILKQTMS